jgi:hypothetical protein
MARLASQQKAGFYPAHETAIAKILRALSAEGPFNILDPCAGKGEALNQLAAAFEEASPWAVELDEGRARACKQKIGDERCLAPADVFNCAITANSIQVLYLNPPYDDEIGGGSTQQQFLHRCFDWLAVGGILIYVVPEDVMGDYSPGLQYLNPRLDDFKQTPFPGEVRKFRESFYIGVKRKYHKELSRQEELYPPIPPALVGSDAGKYVIPKSKARPRTFAKMAMTVLEIERVLAASPLQEHLRPPVPLPLGRPPLPLSKGHTAVLLSAGHLNGTVRPPGEEPHVIRGSCIKETYLKEATTEERDDGTLVNKTVEAERFILSIRAVTQDGTFHELK